MLTLLILYSPSTPQKEQRAYLFLFQLYHIARDAAAAREAKAKAQEELDDKAQQHASYDSQISERKKQQAGLIKERMLVEKKMKKAASDKEKKVGGLVFALDGSCCYSSVTAPCFVQQQAVCWLCSSIHHEHLLWCDTLVA